MSNDATTIHPMTQLTHRIRNLALAAVASVAILAVPATQAFAMDNVTDPGIRCAAKIGPGQYEFYLPGETITNPNTGKKQTCGQDGDWIMSRAGIPQVPPAGGGVNAPPR